MAAAAPGPSGASPMTRDLMCDYTTFRNRPKGKIACLGIDNREITGITFQKVDTGYVSALLPTDCFSSVIWEDSPTKLPPDPQEPPPGNQRPTLNLNNQIQLGQANHVTQQWQEFTTIMGHVKTALLTRMTPRNGVEPQYLLNGFRSNSWISAPDPAQSLHMMGNKMRYWEILEDIEPLLGNYELNRTLREWLQALVAGLCNGTAEFKTLFEYLFPNCLSVGHHRDQFLSLAPAETKNGMLVDGVVHCLTYGFHQNQSRPRSSRPRERFNPDASIRHRLLLPRVSAHRPLNDSDDEDDNELPAHCMDLDHPNSVPDYDAIFDKPHKYIVRPDNLHKYFDFHRPDLLLLDSKETQDQQFPGNTREECQVKISFKVASYKKFMSENLMNAVLYNTELCVRSCLSGFGCDQYLMYGIVIVVDGLKLVKIERQHNQNGEEYVISDTDLILWDQADSMHALFELIEQVF